MKLGLSLLPRLDTEYVYVLFAKADCPNGTPSRRRLSQSAAALPFKDTTPFEDLDISSLNLNAQVALEILVEEADDMDNVISLLTYLHGNNFWEFMNAESTCYSDLGLFVSEVDGAELLKRICIQIRY